MLGVIICHILGSLVSIFVTRHLLRRNFSVLSFRIPSKKDADLFKRLGGKTGAGFLLHGALVLALLSDAILVSYLGV